MAWNAAANELIVADFASNPVGVWRVSGSIKTAVAGPWQFPTGVSKAPDGSFVVVDSNAGTIYRVDPTTFARTVIRSGVTAAGAVVDATHV
jgi:sugar lactone lactonase YvrE